MARRSKEFKDYYSILKVSQTSSLEEVKKAYRKLALELHPDHNPDDPKSEERFKEVTEAYGVLSDPLKKKEYDRYHSDHQAGRSTDSSHFQYSQEDIFSSMFQGENAREIFDELNREFNRSGFRSGNPFFQSVFFGGAVGGLGKILRMIPGPIGKIGMGLKLAQVVGSSLYALHKMKQQKQAPSQEKSTGSPQNGNPLKDGLSGMFGKKNPPKPTLDMDFYLSIPPLEALHGTRKKISYQVNNNTEQLMVRIPPNFPSGGKLRIREKGKVQDNQRGDLILSIFVDPKASPVQE
ncbi:MAG: DnaJ domain-containing protein [Nitrospinaceae bacterium]|jgi:DnaJ-class molecular chaperone|nr:DnaJ domain-containing protein [Nitrospina sp.]MBT5867602.1 DnaJ domain-containing protein [Nitrospinaceae bacterium]MBT6345512.1 DnaJ domain-containing protein [Nitrospina sp.]